MLSGFVLRSSRSRGLEPCLEGVGLGKESRVSGRGLEGERSKAGEVRCDGGSEGPV